jgi:acetyl-CoA carboxylase, biotin carboxylase subunit
MFKKVLIANRGEIAVRVIRACRDMGISPVTIYSDVDRAALQVLLADEAYCLGPASATESYLNIEKVISAARKCGAEAIHPGYGFLSENAGFARACGDAGLKFIGPAPAAMEKMGFKTKAREEMQRAGVPIVPGTVRGVTAAQVTDVARAIGYPVMLKAAAGGGGKGMRLVQRQEDLQSALATASSEAQRAFGDGEVYIEKAVLNPRHIEIQVLADEHGNVVSLGERDCSIQRRHQKVVEESPSSIVNEEMRRRMGEAAVRVAKAVGYTNAGTIEFLVDEERNFYFLEMNTRLQVEHPVTESVTGFDLVQLQMQIAAGQKLPFHPEDIAWRGHAIECRIYAEDTDNNFLPSPGTISRLTVPEGPGIRHDSGIYEGWTVPLDYDPLLAKLIVSGSNREQAISRLSRALHEYFVGGIKTNLPLFRTIVNDPDFQAGKVDTGYLRRLLTSVHRDSSPETERVAAIAAGLFESQVGQSRDQQNHMPSDAAAWKQAARTEALR